MMIVLRILEAETILKCGTLNSGIPGVFLRWHAMDQDVYIHFHDVCNFYQGIYIRAGFPGLIIRHSLMADKKLFCQRILCHLFPGSQNPNILPYVCHMSTSTDGFWYFYYGIFRTKCHAKIP